jgi:hypothetical protein
MPALRVQTVFNGVDCNWPEADLRQVQRNVHSSGERTWRRHLATVAFDLKRTLVTSCLAYAMLQEMMARRLSVKAWRDTRPTNAYHDCVARWSSGGRTWTLTGEQCDMSLPQRILGFQH